MKVTQTRRFSLFGHEIAKFEETRETAQEGSSGGSPERGGIARAIEPLNPAHIAPILIEAIRRNGFPAPEKLMFKDGNELVVDANIDTYLGVQGLKKKVGMFERVVTIVFESTARADAHSKDQLGTSGVLMNHIGEIVKENWEEVKPPTS